MFSCQIVYMLPFIMCFFISFAVYQNWNVSECDTQAKHRWRSYIFSKISYQVLEETVRYGDRKSAPPAPPPGLLHVLTVCSLDASPWHCLASDVFVLLCKYWNFLHWCGWFLLFDYHQRITVKVYSEKKLLYFYWGWRAVGSQLLWHDSFLKSRCLLLS